MEASCIRGWGRGGRVTGTVPGLTTDHLGTILDGETAHAGFVFRVEDSAACMARVELGVTVTSDSKTVSGTVVFDMGHPTAPLPADTPMPIPDSDPKGTASTIEVPDDFAISDLDVRVNIRHTWVGDVRIRLTGPDGTAVTLLDRPGAAPGPLTQYGCNNNDIVAVFSDGEPDPWGVCDNEGDYGGTDEPWPVTRAAPVDPLSVFNGKNVHGTWTLTVSDNATGDTGEILDWELVPTPGFPRSCGVCNDWDILFKDGFE